MAVEYIQLEEMSGSQFGMYSKFVWGLLGEIDSNGRIAVKLDQGVLQGYTVHSTSSSFTLYCHSILKMLRSSPINP